MGRIQKIQKPAELSSIARYFLLFACVILAVTACTPPNTVKVEHDEAIEVEQAQLQESNLLDVGIVVFDGGEISEEQEEDDGITPEIREAEARYISYHLRETMQQTGGWGAINVLPAESEVADVIVTGEILESSGEELHLKVSAEDSTGSQWFERMYLTEVTRRDYTDLEDEDDAHEEIYQGMYNRIANDLNRYRRNLDNKQLMTIRNTSELSYAANLAPAIYETYIIESDEGQVTIQRLPAEDDPSLLRVRKIREREYLLVDTINEHYGNYYDNAQDPYANWRKYYLLETLQKKKIEREAIVKKALGGAAVVGSVLLAILGEGFSPGMAIGGVAIYRDGANASEEAVIHRAAIIELSQSLQSDVQPLVVEVDGETLELTGTLDEQYAQWRVLLVDIYEEDIGLPAEPSSDEFSDG
ncbi:MAG: hypothetical protein AAGB35_08490 [Pseudomonadota bacterium]